MHPLDASMVTLIMMHPFKLVHTNPILVTLQYCIANVIRLGHSWFAAEHLEQFCFPNGVQNATKLLQIPKEAREARRDELISLQQGIGQGFAESLVGQEVKATSNLFHSGVGIAAL